mgnify:FL=1
MTKNLYSNEAIDKLKSLIDGNKIAIFCTELTKLPIQSRPMAVQEVDDEGNLWFISSENSNKNCEIKKDDDVQLFFSNSANSQFLSFYGHATIYTDPEKIEEIWNPVAKAWFEDGKEDQDISVIKVSPKDVYYWDTKDGKIISIFKIAGAALLGTKPDISVEGKLNI